MKEDRFRMPKEIYPRLTLDHIWIGNNNYSFLEWVGKPPIEVDGLKGGKTVVTYEAEIGVCFTGVAYCSPKDFYAKKNGKSLALGRMLRTIPKHLRSRIAGEFVEKFGKVSEEYVYAGVNGIPISEVLKKKKQEALKRARAQARTEVHQKSPIRDRVARQRRIQKFH